MKNRTFFEPPIVYIVYSFHSIFFPLWCLWFVFLAPVTDHPAYMDWLFLILGEGSALILGVYFSQCEDCITVKETGVIWRCLFRRTRRLSYADCRYIGVETANKEARVPIIRGDECACVYLSMDPFPKELKGRINHLRCSDRIIKFRYTDALAEAILAVAPKEKTYLLRGFYNQMQNFDREQERIRKSRRKKKKKTR